MTEIRIPKYILNSLFAKEWLQIKSKQKKINEEKKEPIAHKEQIEDNDETNIESNLKILNLDQKATLKCPKLILSTCFKGSQVPSKVSTIVLEESVTPKALLDFKEPETFSHLIGEEFNDHSNFTSITLFSNQKIS